MPTRPVVTPEVWKGTVEDRQAGPAAGRWWWPCRQAVPASSKTQVARPDPLIAPLAKGQVVGTLKISSGDQPLLDVPLMALEAVEQAGAAQPGLGRDPALDQVTRLTVWAGRGLRALETGTTVPMRRDESDPGLNAASRAAQD